MVVRFCSASDGSSSVHYKESLCGAFSCILRNLDGPMNLPFDYGETVFFSNVTNSDMEVMGILYTLKNLKAFQDDTGKKVICHHYTDSLFAFRSIRDWMKGWSINGWRNSKGELQPQRKLFRECLEIMKEVDFHIHHVDSNHKIKAKTVNKFIKCFDHDTCKCEVIGYNLECESYKYEMNNICDLLCNAIRYKITGQKSVTKGELKEGLQYLSLI